MSDTTKISKVRVKGVLYELAGSGSEGGGSGTGHLILGDDILQELGGSMNFGTGYLNVENLKTLLTKKGVDLTAYNKAVDLIIYDITNRNPINIINFGVGDNEADIIISGNTVSIEEKEYVSLEDLLDTNAAAIESQQINFGQIGVYTDCLYKIYIDVIDISPIELDPGNEAL